MSDAFYAYLEEREKIRLRREAKLPAPWTDDPILREFKFTNVKRIHDRTTKEFAKIYARHSFSEEHIALYNCAMNRYFGTVLWARAIGWQESHSHVEILGCAEQEIEKGSQIFTGAYVITNGGRPEPKYVVVESYLHHFWQRAPRIVAALEASRLWEKAYEEMRILPGFGGTGFMSKEVLQDYLIWLGYRNESLKRPPVEEYVTDFYTFTPVGPGARRGLNRTLHRPVEASLRPSELRAGIGALRASLSPRFKAYFGADLTAHDIQFGLCEFDKYERVRKGEGRPRSRFHPMEAQP